jgi:abequosyltransferase
MLNEDVLLSICIPSYNRPTELSKTLSILSEQVSALPRTLRSAVEIIVSDNHSPYDATALFAAFARELKLDATIRERNVGPTLNFEFCYRRARGRFVFILSDDDHLVEGALAAILGALTTHDPDIVFLPFSPTEDTPAGLHPFRELERNAFLASVGVLPTLISACILKRARLLDVLGTHLDTNMHHYYYFLHSLEHGESFFAFSGQMLTCPYIHNAGGYNWFAAFGDHFFRIVNEFPATRISRAQLTAIEREVLVARIIPTFANRRINGYTINEKFETESERAILGIVSPHCRRFLAFWLLLLPLYLMPVRMLVALKRFNRYARTMRFGCAP